MQTCGGMAWRVLTAERTHPESQSAARGSQHSPEPLTWPAGGGGQHINGGLHALDGHHTLHRLRHAHQPAAPRSESCQPAHTSCSSACLVVKGILQSISPAACALASRLHAAECLMCRLDIPSPAAGRMLAAACSHSSTKAHQGGKLLDIPAHLVAAVTMAQQNGLRRAAAAGAGPLWRGQNPSQPEAARGAKLHCLRPHQGAGRAHGASGAVDKTASEL